MHEAICLARRGAGVSSPNPTVGCVVALNGRVVGRGLHEYALEDHAEVRAIRDAGVRARGATVYVSLEPCAHFGRTPPCADMLVAAGVRRVVVATEDPNPQVLGQGIERLRAAGIRVDVGMLDREARRLIEPFACRVTTGRPLVVAKVGMTLDGRIGLPGRGRLEITSSRASRLTQELRHRLDAVLVGVETVLTDDPRLSYRGRRPKRRPLIRAILDSRLRTPPSAKVLTESEGQVLLFCGPRHSKRRRSLHEGRGAEVIPVPPGRGGLSLPSVLEELGRRGVLGVLVEGGSAVHWSFLSEGLVDKFYFIAAPIVIGGSKAIPAVGGPETLRLCGQSPRATSGRQPGSQGCRTAR